MDVFHGDYKSWASFRDMFTAVYVNVSNISPFEQIFYLKQFTRGEILGIVKKSPLTANKFQEAWNNQDRYECKRILVNSQLRVLFTLAPVKSKASQDIKRLQRDINNSISSLRMHDVNIPNWEPIFVYLCSTKLLVLTLSLWEQTIQNKVEVPK